MSNASILHRKCDRLTYCKAAVRIAYNNMNHNSIIFNEGRIENVIHTYIF